MKPSGLGFSAGGVPYYASGTNFYNALQLDAWSEADITSMLTTHWNYGARRASCPLVSSPCAWAMMHLEAMRHSLWHWILGPSASVGTEQDAKAHHETVPSCHTAPIFRMQ